METIWIENLDSYPHVHQIPLIRTYSAILR
jgi:hypothetical protein